MFKSLTAFAVIAPLAAYAACLTGQSQVSVEGVSGSFCVTGSPVCQGSQSNGVCPGAQVGLENGSFCGRVSSGVYGCKVNDVTTSWTAGVGATKPIVPGPFRCGSGLSPMSVEGVDLVFCVLEPACAAFNLEGNCPGAQDGLKYGAYCGKVSSGVFGCKAYNSSDEIPNDVVYPPAMSCNGHSAGNTPVSVEGVGTFCGRQPVCSGTIPGLCPSQQTGLKASSQCAIVKSGVYGCVLLA